MPSTAWGEVGVGVMVCLGSNVLGCVGRPWFEEVLMDCRAYHREGISGGHVHGVLEVERESKGVYEEWEPVSCFSTGCSGVSQAEADRSKLERLTCSRPVTLERKGGYHYQTTSLANW